MVNPKRPRNQDDKETPEWLEALGPEDMDREEVIENIQDYGFDQMDEDEFVSDPIFPADMPGWYDDPGKQSPQERLNEGTINEQHRKDRPVEDEALDELTEDEMMEDTQETKSR